MREHDVAFPRRRRGPHEHKPWYLSKKWWMSVLAIIIPVINNRLGLNLSVEEMAAIIVPVITYVVVEGWTDAAHKAHKEGDNNENHQYK